jgi:hypothetical protein
MQALESRTLVGREIFDLPLCFSDVLIASPRITASRRLRATFSKNRFYRRSTVRCLCLSQITIANRATSNVRKNPRQGNCQGGAVGTRNPAVGVDSFSPASGTNRQKVAVPGLRPSIVATTTVSFLPSCSVAAIARMATFPKCFTAAGEPIPYPNPTRPDQPGAGAAAGTVAIYKENFDNWQRFMLNSAALREGIVKSLGIDIERTQTDAITGICVHNTNTIMANIAQLYGIVTSADLALLRAELALPLIGTDHTTFSAHGAQFQEKVAILQRSGHPLAQWD